MYEHVQQHKLTCCCLYFAATPPCCPPCCPLLPPCLTFVISICSLAAHCVNPNAFPFLHFFPLPPSSSSCPLFPSAPLPLTVLSNCRSAARTKSTCQAHAHVPHPPPLPPPTILPPLLYASVYLCFVELIDRHFNFTFHFCFHFHFRICFMP